jgi:hypothetical protein
VTDPRALAELERLRRRERDEAERRLIEARTALAACENRRRGWRRRLETEADVAARGDDRAGLSRWVEASRARERALAAEAAHLAEAFAGAQKAQRAAELKLEQIQTLLTGAREARRRDALRREQRWLDDLKPMRGW